MQPQFFYIIGLSMHVLFVAFWMIRLVQERVRSALLSISVLSLCRACLRFPFLSAFRIAYLRLHSTSYTVLHLISCTLIMPIVQPYLRRNLEVQWAPHRSSSPHMVCRSIYRPPLNCRLITLSLSHTPPPTPSHTLLLWRFSPNIAGRKCIPRIISNIVEGSRHKMHPPRFDLPTKRYKRSSTHARFSKIRVDAG